MLNDGKGLSIRDVHGGAVLHRPVFRIPIRRHRSVYIRNADIMALQLFQMRIDITHRFVHICNIDFCPQDAVILQIFRHLVLFSHFYLIIPKFVGIFIIF